MSVGKTISASSGIPSDVDVATIVVYNDEILNASLDLDLATHVANLILKGRSFATISKKRLGPSLVLIWNVE